MKHATSITPASPLVKANAPSSHPRLTANHAVDRPLLAIAPSLVHETLRRSGQPLPTALQASMASRIGTFHSGSFSGPHIVPASVTASHLLISKSSDSAERSAAYLSQAKSAATARPPFGYGLDSVRIHHDDLAVESAADVSAKAYTVGHHIVFGRHCFAPHTADGSRLLLHELVHTLQQPRAGLSLQRDEDPAAQPKTRSFKIKIPPGTTSKEEFRRYAEAIIYGRVINKAWVADPGATAVYSNISQHIGTAVTFDIPISELRQRGADAPTAAEAAANSANFNALPPAEKSEITGEIDRRFHESMGSTPGTRIVKGEVAKIAVWNQLKQQVMTEKSRIDSLPPDIKAFLFDDNALAAVSPKDFEQVLRIVSKVSTLTLAELVVYKSRVTSTTTDWSIFEASLDRFLTERAQRAETEKEVAVLKNRLLNLEDLYKRYRSLLSMQKTNAGLAAMGRANPAALGTSLGSLPTINKMRADLNADLIIAGFPGGISEFEQVINAYEVAFEKQTLAFATVMLDQYANLLWKQEQQYAASGVTDALADQITQSQARADYEEAEKIRDDHASSVVMSIDEMNEQAYWVGERNKALGRGNSRMSAIASGHPLLQESSFPIEKLARASKAQIPAIISQYIADRRKDIAKTRKSLQDKPTMIYGLDKLLQASIAAQNIQGGSISHLIIKDHISDVHWDEAIPGIILGVIAIAAGLLSMGTGTVAVLAAGTALGIGTYQALEEFRRYEMKSAAHGSKLTSDDPTMAWVIIAIVGAGLDAGVFLSVLPKLRPALQAFNVGSEAGDVAKLTQKLEQLTDLSTDIRKTIIQAAAAETEASKAWSLRALMRTPGAMGFLDPIFSPLAMYFGRLVYAAFLTAKKTARDVQVFIKTREAITLIGEIDDIAKLPAAELANLKTAYLAALTEMDTIAAHGAGTLKMTEKEIGAFMKLRADTGGMTAAEVMQEMTSWAAKKASGVPFGFPSVTEFDAFKQLLSKGLKKAGYADAEALLQGSAASGISYSKQVPFGTHSDFDVAISGRSIFNKASKMGMEVKPGPSRIGPLSASEIDELGLGAMHRKLSEAAGAHPVNFMLFKNSGTAQAGIAGIVPVSIPLK